MTLPHAWHTFLHPAPEHLAPRTVRRAERMIVRQWERAEEAAVRAAAGGEAVGLVLLEPGRLPEDAP
jgi:hypothetical protein